MKIFKTTFTFLLTLTFFFLTSCGVNRDIQRNDKSLDPAILIEDASAGVNSFQVGNLADVQATGPFAVSLTAQLEALGGSQGYRLRLSWTFLGAKPDLWLVTGEREDVDPEGRPDPDEIERTTFQADGLVTFVSKPLLAGREYWYDVDAILNRPALKGTVRIKTVSVNLRDAK